MSDIHPLRTVGNVWNLAKVATAAAAVVLCHMRKTIRQSVLHICSNSADALGLHSHRYRSG